MWRATNAASMLLAAAMAWKSPVKCRFRSSIGTTCVRPPPAAPPLMPKIGPRGLAQAQHRPLPDPPQALGERDRGRRLALARLRRRDRRDAHDLGVGRPGQPVKRAQVHL